MFTCSNGGMIFKEKKIFHCMTYLAKPHHNHHCIRPGVVKFKILLHPSLAIITLYMYSVCLIYARE